jgi:surfactin synthase thioesterase subunit
MHKWWDLSAEGTVGFVAIRHPGSSETIRQAPLKRAAKIWSDLHGDMQSQTEMLWPLALSAQVTTMSVPIRCSRRKSEEGCP